MKGKRIYGVNQNYFKEWTHNMAYILGLWWADGGTDGRSFIISLHKKDIDLLKEILKEMNSNHPLTTRFNCMNIKINSVVIVRDVINLGGKLKKSLDIGFPFVPEKYMPDFIRGCFDGDGSIYYDTNGKSYRSSFCGGSREFMLELQKIMQNSIPGFTCRFVKITQKMGTFVCGNALKKDSIRYYLYMGVNNTRRLREYMYYSDNVLKMDRKYISFMKAGEIFLAPKDRKYLSFNKSCDYVRGLKLKSGKEWLKYCTSGLKPKNIPSVPKRIYKNEWIGMEHWLGNMARPYVEAKSFVKGLGLKSYIEWKKYIDQGNKPKDIPYHPERKYKDCGWTNWCEWLGVVPEKYLDFDSAKKCICKENLKSSVEWRIYCRNNKRPSNIPCNPDQYYKSKGWKGYKDFLGLMVS